LAVFTILVVSPFPLGEEKKKRKEKPSSLSLENKFKLLGKKIIKKQT
jgi:hypothetical protein